MNAVWRNGMLYTVSTGASDPAGWPDERRSVVFWRRIATNGWPLSGLDPVCEMDGQIDGDVVGGVPEWRFMPSINVDPQDNVAICYSQSSTSHFVQMCYVARPAADTLPDIWRTQVMVRESAVTYDVLTDGRCRWGDYSVVAVDPVDGSFWASNERAKRYGVWPFRYTSWTTWWVNFDY